MCIRDRLYTTENGPHHTYFLKSKPGKIGYGIGKNVACAGMLQAKNGKIVFIDNSSGHYLPIEDQLKVAVQFLSKKGVLDKNIKISVREPDYEGGGTKEVYLESIMGENIGTILSSYPPSVKRSKEYIESKRNLEKEFQTKVEQLKYQCPQSFLNSSIVNLLPNFQSPSRKGKVDFGVVELDNKKWKALMINQWSDLPETIIKAPPDSFRWDNFSTSSSIETAPQNGVVTRWAACSYTIMHMPKPQKAFSFYLVPDNISSKKESQEEKKIASTDEPQFNSPNVKISCPTLTPDDIDRAMHVVGATQYHHIPAGNIAVIQKGDHKYRLKFTSATHVDVPGARVVAIEDSPETNPGKYVCRYVTQNGDGGHNGDFELALED